LSKAKPQYKQDGKQGQRQNAAPAVMKLQRSKPAIITAIAVYIGLCSVSSFASDAGTLDSLVWLVGTWQRQASHGTLYEKWTKVSDRTYEGDGFLVQNGDTTVTEYLRLEQFGEEVYYTARVPHNTYPVPFKLVLVEGKRCVFENPDHDFPQRIVYTRLPDERLQARIEGLQNGKQRATDFIFTKAKR
jgi:hypothetical protein